MCAVNDELYEDAGQLGHVPFHPDRKLGQESRRGTRSLP